MPICWCTIEVKPNTLINFKKIFKIIFIFFKFYFAADFYERLWYCEVCTHILF